MISSLRCLAVWVAVSTASGATAWWSLAALGPATTFEDLLAATAGCALTACAAWAWLVCSVVVGRTVVARGLPTRDVRGVPAWAVRLVLAACGVAALGIAPAHASSYEVPQVPAPTTTLDGLPFPDRAVGPAHAGRADRQPAAVAPAPRAAGGSVVVRRGDSLWRIAADALGPGASQAEVAVATAALHELNRDVVGADPDLIHPGLRLRTPRS